MFETASRLKVRFPSSVGSLTVEDLWDIPLTSASGVCLDNIAKSLNKEVKNGQEESFVIQKKKANEVSELKFEIVKHIIGVRLAESESRSKALAIKKQKQRIMEIMEEKKDDSFKNKSLEELESILKNM